MHTPLHASLETLLLGTAILMIAAVMAGSLTSRFGLPALIGFLGLGMAAGVDGFGLPFDNYVITKDVGIVCLVLILFSGGLDSPWKAIKGVFAPAAVLATVGVAISSAIVGIADVLVFHASLLSGLMLGVIVACTDAAAVFAVMQASGLNLRRDVRHLIEFESGSNDPTAVFFVLALSALLANPKASVLQLVPNYLYASGMGVAVGLVVGFAFRLIARRLKAPNVELYGVLAAATALLAYGLAETVHANGFFAVYAAGILIASVRFPHKKGVQQFQAGVAWIAQVVMFLALGLLVSPHELPPIAVRGVAVALVVMFVARPAAVFLCLAPFRAFDWRAKLFVAWGGLRGAAPIVLAIFPTLAGVKDAHVIFNIVFFVVLLGSVVQAPTLGWLARRLHLDEDFLAAQAAPELPFEEGLEKA